MRAVRIWTPLGEIDLEAERDLEAAVAANPVLALLGRAVASCSTAELDPSRTGKSRGEATEVGMLEAAQELGIDVAVRRREHRRRKPYRFDPILRLMSTLDEREDGSLTVHAKEAPEEVLRRATSIGGHLPAAAPERLGTASLGGLELAFLTPFPLLVWGADELRRLLVRRKASGRPELVSVVVPGQPNVRG